ncbi:MAG: hypothetical protein HeimC3_52540 [Candidatus Heimdallarchaeota archaeon LC_3]|nr:MAG: hypothetical protein HeimC3_52540 [Candidatus Heimdallarchaeota archaeon LC_3]
MELNYYKFDLFMMNTVTPRRQHYNSRWQLRNFSPQAEYYLRNKNSWSDKEKKKFKRKMKIWTLNLEENSIKLRNIDTVAYEIDDFNFLADKKITDLDFLMADISEEILLTGKFNHVTKTNLSKRYLSLTREEKNYLNVAKYGLTQYFRTPSLLKELQDLFFRREGRTFSIDEIKCIRDCVITQTPWPQELFTNLDITKTNSAEMYKEYLFNILDRNYQMLIRNNTEEAFILGDRVVGEKFPLALIMNDKVFKTETVLNINPMYAIAFMKISDLDIATKRKRYIDALSSKPVKVHNKNIVENAKKFLFAKTEEQLVYYLDYYYN